MSSSPEEPSPQELEGYAKGRLTGPETERIETHLANCEECCRALPSSDLEKRLRAEGLPLWEEVANAAPDHDAEFSVPGYEVLGELGRGGMGVVYRARHLALDRPVALKRMQPSSLNEKGEKVRFQREAEILARLQHPNIVPIYEIGEHQGLLFFAMELLAGGTLSGKLAGGPLPPREAASVVATLAGTMQTAHEAGIVHRDLKPGNVLLTGSGVVKISDFGLARRLDENDGLTQTGTVVGTPEYMAPEQALSKVSALQPTADVYSLGVLLYEAMVGRVPFKAANTMETLRQVIDAEPVSPRRLQPGVPRDLETICLQCLRKEPAKRYPSARALADDLERFLRGEPITARPVGSLERLGLWTRRNPVAAGWAAGAIAIFLGGLIGVSWQWYRAERHLAEAIREKQSADDSFHLGFDAVEELFTRVSEEKLLEQPGMQGLRKDLHASALNYYRRFAEMRRDDATVGPQLAAAHFAMGRILETIATRKEALEAYQEARAQWERVIAESGGKPIHRRHLAATVGMIGRTCKILGRDGDAATAFAEAQRRFEALAVEFPDEEQYQSDLAKCIDEQGQLESLRDPKAGLARLRHARPLFEKLHREHPASLEYAVNLAANLLNRGGLETPEEALERFGEARDVLAPFEDSRESGAMRARQTLASILNNLGDTQRRLDRPAEAEKSLARAIAINTRLANENPLVTSFQSDLAGTLMNLGIVRASSGNLEEAQRSFEEAAAKREELVRKDPTNLFLQEGLAVAHRNRGNVLADRRQPQEAASAYRRSVALRREIAEKMPKHALVICAAAETLHDLSQLEQQSGNKDKAREALQDAEKLLQQHLKHVPVSPKANKLLTQTVDLLNKLKRGADRVP